MQLEVCAFSLASCLTAERAGASRIELCGGQLEGGTTPSSGLIQTALKSLKIPVIVMIRPRGGDFVYNQTEIEVIKTDILHCKALGVKEIILGILEPTGSLNTIAMQELISLANPMKVSLHRAFDMTINYESAIETAIDLECVRILTSGRQNFAADGIENLKNIVKQANGRIEIMAGSGINAFNAGTIMGTGVAAIHLSGSSIFKSSMVFRNPAVSMSNATQSNEYQIVEADFKKISSVAEIIKESVPIQNK